VRVGNAAIQVAVAREGNRVTLTLPDGVVVDAGDSLEALVELGA
jgi:hypothetical protein